MAKDNEPVNILGDISEPARPHKQETDETTERDENDESMNGGSQHDRVRHSGSRDVTEGVTGGTGTEVGGTRNFRQGTGATGGDIGNRPE